MTNDSINFPGEGDCSLLVVPAGIHANIVQSVLSCVLTIGTFSPIGLLGTHVRDYGAF